MPEPTNSTRYRKNEPPGPAPGPLIPLTPTGVTIHIEAGTCCDGTTCLEDGVNEFCCQQSHPGARFIAGRTCADATPCPLCLTDADCDDGQFCNGDESCDESLGCVSGHNPCPPELVCEEATRQCLDPNIPATSEWGLMILALLLCISAKVQIDKAQVV